MRTSPFASDRRTAPFVILLALACVVPVLASGETHVPVPEDHGWMTPGQLYSVDRIAGYEAIPATGAPWDDAAAADERRPYVLGFPELMSDLGATRDPAEAVRAAHGLSEAVVSRQLYEEAGVVLLTAARQARFGQDHERAGQHLRAARHVFDLALREQKADGSASRDTDFVHRAMVRMEEVLVTDSEDPWREAAEILGTSLELFPSGPTADWARRILDNPATYAGEEDLDLESAHHVGGDIRPPVKVFAPPPRLTEIARKARLQGVIIIQLVIDRHGTVAALKLLKGLPMGLSGEALKAMSTWLFEPATLDGQPVAVYYNLTVSFRI